ncbi:hypothetical protein ZWY2020_027906 [Hordeum vulgare]|nr:hypothetical protein ZWY2020_027906 [Hordeum vulgare]
MPPRPSLTSSQLARRGPGEQRPDFGETERGPGGPDAEADGTELRGAPDDPGMTRRRKRAELEAGVGRRRAAGATPSVTT